MSRRAMVPAALFAAALLMPGAGRADRLPVPQNVPAAYASECAACHTAYPPGLLPAASWARIMGALDKHYGSNAALEGPVLGELSHYLRVNAGTYKRATATADARITSADWFVREHRGVAAATWKLPGVGGASNCGSCHAGAAGGDFSERTIRIPK